MRYVFLALLVALSFLNATAHSIWIETAASAKKGEAHEIKVFFGAYESNKPDSTKKWFSDIEDFTLTVSAPDGKTTGIRTVQDLLFFKGNFIPDQDGTYFISISHLVKDLYKGSKLQYYAIAKIQVGDLLSAVTQPDNLTLSLLQQGNSYNQNQLVTQKLIFNKLPLAKQNITIVAPDLISIEVETDNEGAFNFTPKQKGQYFIEAFYEEDKAGSHHGTPFKKSWHMVTQQLTSK